MGSASRAQPRGLSCLPLSAGGRDPGGGSATAQPPPPPSAPSGDSRRPAPCCRAVPCRRSTRRLNVPDAAIYLSAAGAGKVPQAPQPLAAAPHVPARCLYLRVIFLPAPWRKWESWRGPAGR